MCKGRVLLSVTILSALAFTSCGARETSPQSAPQWKAASVPAVKGETHALPNSLMDPLNDGTYWAEIARIQKTGQVIFQLYKARFGATCTAWAKENGIEEGCLDDYSVENSYERFVVGLAENARISVAQQDMPGKSYRITQEDLGLAMQGRVKGAPQDYEWVPFPFLVHIANKEVVSAEQFWVP